MSEHITHVAIFEDCYRIMQVNAPSFPTPFLHALSQHYDSGIICCGSRGNARYALPIIEKYRGMSVGDLSDEGLQHLSGALGWISHRAADAVLNPMADEMDETDQPMFNGQDLKRYYEIVVMHEVYNKGYKSTLSKYEPLSPATLATDMQTNPASQYVNMKLFEPLITNYYLREFLGLMHFQDSQTPGDLDTQLDNMLSHVQYFQEQLSLYIDAFENPEAMKLQEFVHNLDFYNPDDELIRLVRKLQEGHQVGHEILNKTLADADNQCKYARTLKLNYDFWMAAGAYYNGDIELNELQDQLMM